MLPPYVEQGFAGLDSRVDLVAYLGEQLKYLTGYCAQYVKACPHVGTEITF